MSDSDKMFLPLLPSEKKKQNSNSALSDRDQGIAVTPVPKKNIKDEIPFHYKLGKPSKVWDYKNLNGELLFRVCRFIKNGEKQDRPLTYRKFQNGSYRWSWKALDIPRPLYGLDRLATSPDSPILVCEGEKAADAAQLLFPKCTAITSSNGAAAADKSDWSPISGRHVIIWPDNDAVGRNYAHSVTALARKAGAVSVTIVSIPPEFPEKWDLADPLPPNFTTEDLQNMLNSAEIPEISANPLEGLIEKSMIDPGCAFKEEVITALADLRSKDRAAFESILSRLKETKKVRISELIKIIDEISGAGDDENISQTDILLSLASDIDLFHTPDMAAYAEVPINDHKETWPVESQGFRLWLVQRYFETIHKAPNAEALNAAINTIRAEAYFNAPEHDVFIRAGHQNNKIYIDLCNPRWEAVEIDSEGWRIVNISSVKFRRVSGMQALPTPEQGGSINSLKEFLNIKEETDFILLVSWLLSTFRGQGPYPVLAISGEQGSAKSTFESFMKKIADPNSSALRTLPRDERDLFIAANNGYVLAFDNLSFLPSWLSDALCRLSTGGGFATRKLTTDLDEILFQAMRPVIMNGIDEVITRPDLADRTITLNLEPIPEDKRKTEQELTSAFKAALPSILGALFDGVSYGLRKLPETKLEKLPRMADFALWGTACEQAFWPPGTFIEAYSRNNRAIIENVLESNDFIHAVKKLIDIGNDWKGTASKLLEDAGIEVTESIRRSPHWPKTPQTVTSQLKRAATFLRKQGIEVVWERDSDRNRTRNIHIFWATYKIQNLSSEPSDDVALSSKSEENQRTSDSLTDDDIDSVDSENPTDIPDDTDEPDDGF